MASPPKATAVTAKNGKDTLSVNAITEEAESLVAKRLVLILIMCACIC